MILYGRDAQIKIRINLMGTMQKAIWRAVAILVF